jgi:hypothetical protein
MIKAREGHEDDNTALTEWRSVPSALAAPDEAGDPTELQTV